jgi:Xaa-Pro dipeptidase
MRKDVIQKQKTAMKAAGLDVLVAISPENFAYGTGFIVPSQPLMRWRHAICAVNSDGKSGIVAVDMEETTVRGKVPDADIRIWGEFTDKPMNSLAQLLSDLGATNGKIGIEMNYLPAGDHEHLKRLLPGAMFIAADQIFDQLRQIKSTDEIDLLRRLSRISDTAIAASFDAVKAGMTEMDMAAALTRSVYEQGAEHFKLMIVATGPRSELPNVGPTERVLEAGDICRVEIFSIIGGYHAGVCRTASVEDPPEKAVEIWKNLVECKYRVLDAIKPSASAKRVYEIFLEKFGELGLPPISFVGHGIGLHLHEDPYLGKYEDYTLEAGMVLGIEPLVYQTGHGFGLQLKDMITVTKTGAELLSDSTDTDTLYRIG